ncbi:TPA: hypothetical protein OT180_002248 [Morganella morganii]|nr:hypothetical protein [Morganella morganii]
MESEYSFLKNHFDDIVLVLKGMEKDKFVTNIRSILSSEYNEKYKDNNSIEYLYKCIEDVVNLIEENKISISKICKVSDAYGELSYGDDTVERIDYLLWSYVVLVRYIYEYMYNVGDSFSIERMTYAISDFKNFDFIFSNITQNKFRFFYLYVRDVYAYKVMRNDNEDLNKKIKNINKLSGKVDAALSSNESISVRLDKFEFFEDEKYTGFEKKLTEITDSLENRIDVKAKEIQDMMKVINEMNDSVTFMGLDNAYKKIHDEKIAEKENALYVLWLSAILVLVPLVIKVSISIFNSGYVSNIYDYGLTVTGTVIFIYYFRVALLNYNSIKTELMQIKLRRGLCMFISMYVDFSKRNDNPESLSKFETLIFSNIIPDDKKVPSTLDGIEQLAKLINSLKNK